MAVRVARASGLLAVIVAGAMPAPAEACGGAFFPAREDAIAVSGHQMAMAISKTQTVVWDRIEVAGDPSELAWVIPVHQGARLELSNEKWFSALAATTQTTVRAEGASSNSGGGGGGCIGGASPDESAAAPDTSRGEPVTVVDRADIGPYDTAKLRSTEPGAIRNWLVENQFAIPDDIGPVLDAYTREGFDFIALRVRPGSAGIGLQPVRLTTPGADPTLPFRMSSAGVQTSAALTLFVIAEGRYRVRGFQEVEVDRSAVRIDNYESVIATQLAAGDGRRFVVEHAGEDEARLVSILGASEGACEASTSPALGESDAGADASVKTCGSHDFDVAHEGMAGNLWITRLRAQLPKGAFASDLHLEASPAQVPISSDYHLVGVTSMASIAPARPGSSGSFVLVGVTLIGLGAFLKRRPRRTRTR